MGAPPGPLPGPARLAGRSSGGHVAERVQDALDPALGRIDLAVARQRLGAVPQAGQGDPAPGVRDRPDEALALLVLLHLQVEAREPEHRSLERRPARRVARGTGR